MLEHYILTWFSPKPFSSIHHFCISCADSYNFHLNQNLVSAGFWNRNFFKFVVTCPKNKQSEAKNFLEEFFLGCNSPRTILTNLQDFESPSYETLEVLCISETSFLLKDQRDIIINLRGCDAIRMAV